MVGGRNEKLRKKGQGRRQGLEAGSRVGIRDDGRNVGEGGEWSEVVNA